MPGPRIVLGWRPGWCRRQSSSRAALGLAQTIAANGPLAIRMTGELVRRAVLDDPKTGWATPEELAGRLSPARTPGRGDGLPGEAPRQLEGPLNRTPARRLGHPAAAAPGAGPAPPSMWVRRPKRCDDGAHGLRTNDL